MWQRRFLTLTLTALLATCAAPNLPSITDRPTGQHVVGEIIWHDLITNTPEESKRFYAALFGWEFEDLDLHLGLGRTLNYTLIRHRGQLIGGMVDANKLHREHPERLSQWVAVMSIVDVDQAVATAHAQGGKVLTPPTELGDRGRIAVIEDPQGAAVALLKSRDGDPADRVPQVGDFVWDEVWTNDVAASISFYAGISGLKATSRKLAPGHIYNYLEAGDLPCFGILEDPAEGLKPTWVSYIRVESPTAIAAQVEQLGGKVLAEPRARDLGGQIALIADPSGAPIAIQTWSPTKSGGG